MYQCNNSSRLYGSLQSARTSSVDESYRRGQSCSGKPTKVIQKWESMICARCGRQYRDRLELNRKTERFLCWQQSVAHARPCVCSCSNSCLCFHVSSFVLIPVPDYPRRSGLSLLFFLLLLFFLFFFPPFSFLFFFLFFPPLLWGFRSSRPFSPSSPWSCSSILIDVLSRSFFFFLLLLLFLFLLLLCLVFLILGVPLDLFLLLSSLLSARVESLQASSPLLRYTSLLPPVPHPLATSPGEAAVVFPAQSTRITSQVHYDT